ncbi:MAG: leucyl aminopeptidase [Rhodospirillaceae bacterium]|jgi:leucyl aminopeptidase|nr:leucyl aminopeptidase [Rhodospirillaceae bacterium]MBT5014734.1 leucyl aminopeptidase [Rhodospirillaceae bacterium]MBT5309436.1 leucyl aminopeptidase [Rhodospirillaceae bacterium]MBT6407177.1 leucyl aminopeptidase [Rhodospirillaceae bacterium]MBT7355152.1 leucyl aminopeptidase [Rhodospirillaceae bacterium]
MKPTFANPVLPKTGTVVVPILDGRKLLASAKNLDKQMKGGLMRAIKASQFKGSKGHSLHLLAPAGTKLDRVMVVGLGKPTDVTDSAMQAMGGRIYTALASKGKTASVLIDSVEKSKMSPARMAAEVAYGGRLASYRFDKYRTKARRHNKPTLKTVKVLSSGTAQARKLYRDMDKVADGVFFTRDLVSEPSNVLYPETLAAEAKKLAKLGVKVEVLGEARMRKLGMGALLGVGQGSVHEPKLVVMQWNGAPKSKEKPIAFVGKGVTFDTGGISIKPSGGMEDMKWDMAGSGVVIGLMKALAGRKAKVNAVAVVGLVENMPGGNAQRPGDIVTSMSGQTIEVLNTDAEGRLVLADALWYTKERFKPKFMVNLATLTGAIIVCLGNERAGLFSNNDVLSKRLSDAGDAVSEQLWRFPMGDVYDKMINCDIADMKNISGGRGAGSITAAQFLKRFVGTTPWAHLDIAGVTWSNKAKPTVPKGGTAFGVRLLDRMVKDYYEAK